jgi:hypothetical protein
VRWKLPLEPKSASAVASELLEELYDSEEGLWGYFVEGAPALLATNVCALRGLVNGAPCLMHTLSFGAAGIPDVLDAAMRANIYAEVVLDEPPACMHVLVTGGTWHGLDLDDLSAQVGDLCTADVGSRAASAAAGRPIVIVPLGKDKEDKKKLSSVLAAQHELPKHVAVGTLAAGAAGVRAHRLPPAGAHAAAAHHLAQPAPARVVSAPHAQLDLHAHLARHVHGRPAAAARRP